jgi:predicted DNA-binding transcriptional regulator YafY
MRMLARMPYEWRIEVRFDAPLEELRHRVSPSLAELTEDGEGTLLELGADSLEWAAGLLAGIGAEFKVIRPDELRGELAGLSQRLERAAL